MSIVIAIGAATPATARVIMRCNFVSYRAAKQTPDRFVPEESD